MVWCGPQRVPVPLVSSGCVVYLLSVSSFVVRHVCRVAGHFVVCPSVRVRGCAVRPPTHASASACTCFSAPSCPRATVSVPLAVPAPFLLSARALFRVGRGVLSASLARSARAAPSSVPPTRGAVSLGRARTLTAGPRARARAHRRLPTVRCRAPPWCRLFATRRPPRRRAGSRRAPARGGAPPRASSRHLPPRPFAGPRAVWRLSGAARALVPARRRLPGALGRLVSVGPRPLVCRVGSRYAGLLTLGGSCRSPR